MYVHYINTHIRIWRPEKLLLKNLHSQQLTILCNTGSRFNWNTWVMTSITRHQKIPAQFQCSRLESTVMLYVVWLISIIHGTERKRYTHYEKYCKRLRLKSFNSLTTVKLQLWVEFEITEMPLFYTAIMILYPQLKVIQHDHPSACMPNTSWKPSVYT